jgi:hypothetical protein
MFGLQLQVAPLVEPVSLEAAKKFCVVSQEFTDDDETISDLITAGRQEAEKYTRRAFFNQTWLLSLDYFPLFWSRETVKNITNSSYPFDYFFQGMSIGLPRPQTVSITSFNYRDNNGNTQSLTSDDYILDINAEPGRLIPAVNSFWPTTSVYSPGSIQITYVAGTFGDGVEVDTCPKSVCTAIKVFTSHYYVNREGDKPIPDAFFRLLDSVKFTSFGYQAY